MTCYWMARAKINDAAEYKKYTDLAPVALVKYGGKVLAHGGPHETLEGSPYFERFVLVEFDSMEAARRCFRSAEYEEAATFRRAGAGDNELTIVESGDMTS